MEEAVERSERIRLELQDGLIYPFEMYIKRACTEMEDKFGPSDKWESRPDWAELEARLNQIIVFPDDNQLGRMADWHIRWMFREWIRRCERKAGTARPDSDWACLITFVNQDHAQTARQADEVQFSVTGDTATCRIGDQEIRATLSFRSD